MLYQQMKDQYTLGGQQAMQDTMGQASAMTGGYGNSYAQSAGQQAYQSYMQQLNNNIPQLYDRKYKEYMDQGQQLLSQYGLASDMENQDYGKYRDYVGDWQNMLNHYYGAWQDQVGNSQWQESFNYQAANDKYARDMAAAQAAASRRGGGGGRGRGGSSGWDMSMIQGAADAYATNGRGGLSIYIEDLIKKGKLNAEQAYQLSAHTMNYGTAPEQPKFNSPSGGR